MNRPGRPAPPVPPHLSWYHPLARWRHIARSPAYRFGAVNRWNRGTVAVVCVVVELTFLAIGIWGLGLDVPAGREIRGQLHVLTWGFLVLATCAAGAFAFHPEQSSGAMEQLVLTPMESYDVIRDRAFAAAAPLAPAAAVAVIAGLTSLAFAADSPLWQDSFVRRVMLLDAGCWLWLFLLLLNWGLAVLSGCAAAYMAFAIGMWSGLKTRSPFLSLPLALIWMVLIGAAVLFFRSEALVPTVVMAPFFYIILAGLFLASCEGLFSRQRLPGEIEDDAPKDPDDDATAAADAGP